MLITGLAMQLATFAFFFAIVAQFHMLTRGVEGVREGAGNGWRKVLLAVYVSSGLIIVSRPRLNVRGDVDWCNADSMHLSTDRVRAGNFRVSIHP